MEMNVSIEEVVKTIDELIYKSQTHNSTYHEKLSILEEAHLLSQPYAVPHLKVHWEMFKLAYVHRVWPEFIGQIPRLILAMPGSWLGKAPKGNVGSTRMGIFEEASKN